MKTTIQSINDLSSFARAYLLCAIWLFDENAPFGDYSISGRFEEIAPKLAPETLLRAQKDCLTFIQNNAGSLRLSGLSDEQAGHSFWLSRNGHGSGFSDRIDLSASELEQKVCELLQENSKRFREVDLYAGGDGLIYMS